MSITPAEFDSVIEEWKEWQSLPWGRLFYSTAHHNLDRHLTARHLPARPLRILDVGGGSGMDALYFAALGHNVTLVDYSPAMLAEARREVEARSLSNRVRLIQGDAGKIDELLDGCEFDLVLCSLMVEFVADADKLLRDLPGLLAPGGLLSLIDANRHAEAFRTALLQNDLAAALKAVDTRIYPHRWFGRDVPMFSAEEMIPKLEACGLALVARYGIWAVTPYLPNEPKYDPGYYAQLEAVEHALSGTYPYFLLSRFFHIVMQKKGAPQS